MPPERNRGLLVGHLGDVRDGEPPVVQRKAADLVDRRKRAEPAHRRYHAIRPDASERHVAVHARNALGHLAEVHPVGGEPVEAQVDPHLARLDAVEVHAGDPRNPPDRVRNPPFQAVVVRRQVHPGSRDAGLDDRDLRRREGVDVDLLHVGRKILAGVLDGLEYFGPRDVHRCAPGELELEVGAVGGGGRADPAGAGNGGERFLERLDDLPFDLLRARVRIGNGYEDAGEVHVRQVGEGDAGERDAAEHQQAEQHHRGGDGPVDGETGKTHTVKKGTPVSDRHRCPPGKRNFRFPIAE